MNKISKIIFLAVVCLLLTSGQLYFGSSDNLSEQSQEEYLPVVNELPDLFLSKDGSRVTTIGQWKSHREELIEKLLKYEYGHLAQSSPVHVINESADSIIRDGNDIIRKKVVNLKTGPGGEISFTLNLFVPDKSEGPFPVIIDGDLCWGSLLKRLKPEGLISLVKRGYIIVEFDRTIFAADRNTRDKGVFPLYPNYDWGALAAWAWGFHRTIDYLLTQSAINKDKICVTGWSRGGKACLLAGALDERIALVAPNCSGTCGSGPLRYVDTGGEKIDNIATTFPYWFNPTFRKFTGKAVETLPFDQHTLIALVAPRAYLCTNGLKDAWANPKGTAQAHLAAKEAFKALGVENKIGIFYTNSGHDHNIDKWIALLDFADLTFYGKKTSYDYNKIPFNDLPKAYSWTSSVLSIN